MSALASHPSKRCIGCGESKPLDAFYAHVRGREGRQSRCKACDNHNRLKRGLAPDLSRADGRPARRRASGAREVDVAIDDEPEADIQPFVNVDEASEVLCARAFRSYDRDIRERDAAAGKYTPAPHERDGVEWTTLDQYELERWVARVRLVGYSGPVTARSEAARANGLITPAPADSSAASPEATASSSGGPENDDVAPAPEVAPPRVRGAPRARASPRVFLAPAAGPAEIVASTPDVAPEPDAAGATCAADPTPEREAMPSTTTVSERQRAILDAYNANPSPRDVAEKCGTTPATVNNVIVRLRKLGLVTARARAATVKGQASSRAKVKEAPRAAARAASAPRGGDAKAGVDEDPILAQLRARRAELVATHEAQLARIDAAIDALGGEAA